MDDKKVSPHHRGYRKMAKAPAKGGKPEGGAYGGFIRMSHEYSVERGSIENHRLEISRIAAQRGLNLTEWYVLPAVSGKAIWNHPVVVQMRADIAAGRIKGIVFTKLARVCRNMSELIAFRDFFVGHGADMICPEFDTRDAGGKVLYNILAVLAEWERDLIADRVLASVRPRAERGQNLGGAPKYGFQWAKARVGDRIDWVLEQNPEEVAVIRQLLETFLTWQSFRTTARELSRTVKTRGGFRWSDSRVIEILTNPIYRGRWIRNRTTNRDGEILEKDASEWVTKDIPRIFSPGEAQRIDGIIAHIQANYTRPQVVQRFLLTQIRCGVCGGRVYGTRRKDGSTYYKCQKCVNSIPVHEMDQAILDELKNIHRNGEQIARLSVEMEKNVAEHARLVRMNMVAREQHQALDRRMAELVEGSPLPMPPAVRKHLDSLQAQADALAARIAELEREAQGLIQIEDVTTFLGRVAEIPRLIQNLPEGRARYQLLRGLIPQITLGRETIDYQLNFLKDLPVLGEKLQTTGKGRPQLYSGQISKIRLDPSLFSPNTPLGKRLRWAREYMGLDAKDLAKAWGRSKDTVWNWEHGRTYPTDSKDVRRIEAFVRRAQKQVEKRLRRTK